MKLILNSPILLEIKSLDRDVQKLDVINVSDIEFDPRLVIELGCVNNSYIHVADQHGTVSTINCSQLIILDDNHPVVKQFKEYMLNTFSTNIKEFSRHLIVKDKLNYVVEEVSQYDSSNQE